MSKELILINIIKSFLTDDLRYPRFKGSSSMAGFCYIANEVFYHMAGGKIAGFTPHHIKHEGVSHWYLKHKSGRIIDITVEQFKTVPDYTKGRGKGFLTKRPSKRAQTIMNRINKEIL